MTLITNPLDENRRTIGENSISENTKISPCEHPGLSNIELQRLVGRLTPEEIKAIQSLNPKRKKFEEVKRMAWEFFVGTISHDTKKKNISLIPMQEAWEHTQRFYDFAKQKEEEMRNEKFK